jgi:O-antigen/teichoic acid export membrane protein
MTSVNKGIAWSGIAQAIISISDLLSMGVTLALFVDEKNYGVAALALWVFPVLDSITDFGIANAVIQKDGHSTSKLSTVFWLNSFIATILCGFLFLLAPWYASRVGQPTVAALMIAYCGKLILQNGYTIPIALMRKELRFAEIAKIRTAAHVAESISRPILAASGAVVWCFVIPLLIRSVLVLVMVQWRHRFIPSLTFRYREVTDYVRFGLKSGATAALYQLYVNIDYPLVGFIFGPSALGAYKLAYELVLEPVRSITNVVSDVALPTIAKIKHDMPQVRARYLGFVRTAVFDFAVSHHSRRHCVVRHSAIKREHATNCELCADSLFCRSAASCRIYRTAYFRRYWPSRNRIALHGICHDCDAAMLCQRSALLWRPA